MIENTIALRPLTSDDREQFILDNQRAFKYGAKLLCDGREAWLDDGGEIISRDTIVCAIDDPATESYRIFLAGRKVGGAIVRIDPKTHHNHLELFFVLPEEHGKGIGYRAWRAIEECYPETRIWETYTPYFEKRNIHFYVNKCGFHITAFYNAYHADPHMPQEAGPFDEGPDEMFRFTKVMKQNF